MVRAFSIDQTTGILNSIGANDTVSTGTNPIWSTIDPAGKVLYTANIDSNDVSAFTIDSRSGALTPIGTYAAGQGPISVSVDPSGKFVYVPNVFDGSTYSYTRDSTGALSLTGVIAGSAPNDVASITPFADPDSGFAQLNGNNTFNGNQTTNGNVTATSFVGDGSGLTGVTSSGLNCTGCVGNTQLAVSYAAADAQGGNALNALKFGGLLPTAFATLGANSFNGSQIVQGSLGSAALSATQGGFAGTGVLGTGPSVGVVGVGIGSFGFGGIGVQGQTTNGIAGQFFVNGNGNGKILSGTNVNTEVFSVSGNGSVNTSGNLTTVGAVTIVPAPQLSNISQRPLTPASQH